MDKWFDYGNGLINLSHVTHIKLIASPASRCIEFDSFKFDLGATGSLADGHEQRKTAEKQNKEKLEEIQKKIVDFLKSNKTYLQLLPPPLEVDNYFHERRPKYGRKNKDHPRPGLS